VAKPFYVQFELPSSFLVGDKLNIDVIINNFYSSEQNVDLEYTFSDKAFSVAKTSESIKVPKKTRKTHTILLESIVAQDSVFFEANAKT